MHGLDELIAHIEQSLYPDELAAARATVRRLPARPDLGRSRQMSSSGAVAIAISHDLARPRPISPVEGARRPGRLQCHLLRQG